MSNLLQSIILRIGLADIRYIIGINEGKDGVLGLRVDDIWDSSIKTMMMMMIIIIIKKKMKKSNYCGERKLRNKNRMVKLKPIVRRVKETKFWILLKAYRKNLRRLEKSVNINF